MLHPSKLVGVDNKLLLDIASFAFLYGKGHLYETKDSENEQHYIYLSSCIS